MAPNQAEHVETVQTSEAVAAAHELATSFDGRVTATKGGKAEEQEGEEQEIKSNDANADAGEEDVEFPDGGAVAAEVAGGGGGGGGGGAEEVATAGYVEGLDINTGAANTLDTHRPKSGRPQGIIRRTSTDDGSVMGGGIDDHTLREDGTEMGMAQMTETNLLEQLYSEGYAELYGLSGAHTLAMTNETEVLLQVIDDEAEAGQQVANIPDAVGRTPLMFAALNGSVRAAELLLSKGALVEAKDADGRSAVDWASYHGQSKVLKVLLGVLAPGAHLPPDKEGRSTMHWIMASPNEAGSTKCLGLLLKNALTAEVVDPLDLQGMTPLHWSAFHNKPKHCAALLKAGADSRALDYEGKTALHWSCSPKGAACAKVLINFDPNLVNIADGQSQTPLHMSIGERAAETTGIFVKSNGVALDAQDNTDRTPLMWAAALGDAEGIEVLLKAGADRLIQDGQLGGSALHYAAQYNHLEAVTMLLDGANSGFVNIVDVNGASPLVWAISNGSVDVITSILTAAAAAAAATAVAAADGGSGVGVGVSNGAADGSSAGGDGQAGKVVDRQDNDGRTALHASAYAGNVQATELLIKHDAALDVVDTVGQSPLFTACEHGHADVCNALLHAGCRHDLEDSEGRHAIHWASIGGFEQIVSALLTAGATATYPDGRGETPLHYAAFFGRSATAALLCDASSPDVQDYDGITPVHWTALQGHPDTLAVLLERGAYPNYMEGNGDKATPLDYAVNGNHTECAAMLEQYGGVDYKQMELYAVLLIQKHFREWRKRNASKQEHEHERRKSEAATTIAAHYRGHKARQSVSMIRQEKQESTNLQEKKLEDQELERAAEITKLALAKKEQLNAAIADRYAAHQAKAQLLEDKISAAEQEAAAHRQLIEKQLQQQRARLLKHTREREKLERDQVEAKRQWERQDLLLKKREGQVEKDVTLQRREAERRLTLHPAAGGGKPVGRATSRRDGSGNGSGGGSSARLGNDPNSRASVGPGGLLLTLSMATDDGDGSGGGSRSTASSPSRATPSSSPTREKREREKKLSEGNQASKYGSSLSAPEALKAAAAENGHSQSDAEFSATAMLKATAQMVQTEKRRVTAIRVKLRAARIIQRAFRNFKANGFLRTLPKSGKKKQRHQTNGGGGSGGVGRKPPQQRGTSVASTIYGNTAQQQQKVHQYNGATPPMNMVGLVDSATQRKREEVAVLTIQLWWRRYKSWKYQQTKARKAQQKAQQRGRASNRVKKAAVRTSRLYGSAVPIMPDITLGRYRQADSHRRNSVRTEQSKSAGVQRRSEKDQRRVSFPKIGA